MSSSKQQSRGQREEFTTATQASSICFASIASQLIRSRSRLKKPIQVRPTYPKPGRIISNGSLTQWGTTSFQRASNNATAPQFSGNMVREIAEVEKTKSDMGTDRRASGNGHTIGEEVSTDDGTRPRQPIFSRRTSPQRLTARMENRDESRKTMDTKGRLHHDIPG